MIQDEKYPTQFTFSKNRDKTRSISDDLYCDQGWWDAMIYGEELAHRLQCAIYVFAKGDDDPEIAVPSLTQSSCDEIEKAEKRAGA